MRLKGILGRHKHERFMLTVVPACIISKAFTKPLGILKSSRSHFSPVSSFFLKSSCLPAKEEAAELDKTGFEKRAWLTSGMLVPRPASDGHAGYWPE